MDFSKLPDRLLLALYRVAKTKARVFFRDPKAMIALRNEVERRGLK